MINEVGFQAMRCIPSDETGDNTQDRHQSRRFDTTNLSKRKKNPTLAKCLEL